MELSRMLIVTENGLHLNLRDIVQNFTKKVYGVHQTEDERTFIWNLDRGLKKSVSDDWFKSEDGQQFLNDLQKDFEQQNFGSEPIEFDEDAEPEERSQEELERLTAIWTSQDTGLDFDEWLKRYGDIF